MDEKIDRDKSNDNRRDVEDSLGFGGLGRTFAAIWLVLRGRIHIRSLLRQKIKLSQARD
jgi:hypothetical protein